MILSGDVGGTKCNLALFEQGDGIFSLRYQSRFSSHDYPGFAPIVAAFLRQAGDCIRSSQAGRIVAAGFGVAGPVIGKRVQITNLGWELDSDQLARQTGASRVVLLNDLEATGYGLAWLAPSDLLSLNPGHPRPRAPRALIAAGTGLGESVLHFVGDRYIVAPTEGGHCDFAPRTETEIELLRYLLKSGRPVSFEMILSGRGFLTIHQFLAPRISHPGFDDPHGDPAPEITRRALEKSCPVCVETLDLWVSIYGAEAGNLALKSLAVGGVFIAGGIVLKILPKMTDGSFMQAFCRKSHFAGLLAEIPVQVVLSEQAPLLGAAAEAALAAGG